MTTSSSTKVHEEHSARNADEGHTHHQGEIRDLKKARNKLEKESYNIYIPEV